MRRWQLPVCLIFFIDVLVASWLCSVLCTVVMWWKQWTYWVTEYGAVYMYVEKLVISCHIFSRAMIGSCEGKAWSCPQTESVCQICVLGNCVLLQSWNICLCLQLNKKGPLWLSGKWSWKKERKCSCNDLERYVFCVIRTCISRYMVIVIYKEFSDWLT